MILQHTLTRTLSCIAAWSWTCITQHTRTFRPLNLWCPAAFPRHCQVSLQTDGAWLPEMKGQLFLHLSLTRKSLAKASIGCLWDVTRLDSGSSIPWKCCVADRAVEVNEFSLLWLRVSQQRDMWYYRHFLMFLHIIILHIIYLDFSAFLQSSMAKEN